MHVKTKIYDDWFDREDLKKVLSAYYWDGIEGYNPACDPFYRR